MAGLSSLLSEASVALYKDALRSKSPAGFNPQCAGIPAVRRGTLELMRSEDLLNRIRALAGADTSVHIQCAGCHRSPVRMTLSY